MMAGRWRFRLADGLDGPDGFRELSPSRNVLQTLAVVLNDSARLAVRGQTRLLVVIELLIRGGR